MHRRSRFVIAVVGVVVVERVYTVAPGRADAAGRTPAKVDAVAGASLGRVIQQAQGGNGGGQCPSLVLLPARVLEVAFPSPALRPLASQWQWQYHHGAVAAARFAVLVAAPACVEVGILARGRRVVVCITALVDGARFWLDAAAKAKGSSESVSIIVSACAQLLLRWVLTQLQQRQSGHRPPAPPPGTSISTSGTILSSYSRPSARARIAKPTSAQCAHLTPLALVLLLDTGLWRQILHLVMVLLRLAWWLNIQICD
ncbi:hypothetical protein K438DRAFT_1975999 [Mycena galopus ATCC 62051]|nr:hypothetical protein K438DRAFT_1975999 [Mycena galopus ATCC 62051]